MASTKTPSGPSPNDSKKKVKKLLLSWSALFSCCTKWCASSSRIKFLTHQSSQSLWFSFLSISANHGWKIGQDASASKNPQVSLLLHCCASSSQRTCAWSPHVAGVQPLKQICHLQNSTEQRCKKMPKCICYDSVFTYVYVYTSIYILYFSLFEVIKRNVARKKSSGLAM